MCGWISADSYNTNQQLFAADKFEKDAADHDLEYVKFFLVGKYYGEPFCPAGVSLSKNNGGSFCCAARKRMTVTVTMKKTTKTVTLGKVMALPNTRRGRGQL